VASNTTVDLGGSILLENFAYGSSEVAVVDSGDVLSVTSDGSTIYTQQLTGAYTDEMFAVTSNTSGSELILQNSVPVICFVAGTLIDTPTGEVRVEKLRVGDRVMTAHNGPRKVIWIGTGMVLATRGKRSVETPVIVRKGALADNLPHQDLHITKAHALYIDGVLIPVEFLVNHQTIVWDDRAQEVEIYHVELQTHDVLIANGVPAESYRDDDNRWLFRNYNESWRLPPREPCVPVLTGGPVVDTVWQRLLDLAGTGNTEPLTDDPDLHLIIDGKRLNAREHTDSTYIFHLPATPACVVVASRVGVPSELGIARDPRALGVALRQVTIRQGARFMLFDADDERLTTGFHGYEPADNLRWTNGHAVLPIEAFARFDQGAEVVLRLGAATRYADEQAAGVHGTSREELRRYA
jgi:hypothetical protein